MDEKKLVTANPFAGLDNRQPVPRKQKPVEQQPEEVKEPLEPVEEVKAEAPTDLLAGLSEKKPETKSYSFYLDNDVVVQLDKLAKKNKKSRSKVLNTLLRNYLLSE